MKHGYLALSGLCFALFSGCNIINPEEKEAAYIAVNTITLATDADLQGSNSNKIQDAWIYVDDNLVGAFSLPCKIPVLKSGVHKVSIGAGIQVNGSSTLRTPYAFYKFYEQSNVLLEPGLITAFNPQVNYFDSLTFAFKANFDDLSGNKLTATPYSDTTTDITTDPSKVFEGSGSFRISLRSDTGIVDFQMIEAVGLPKSGTVIFLEMDYKTNQDLIVGLRANILGGSTSEKNILTLRPTTTWKKVYVNLTSAVSSQTYALNYKVFFASYKPTGSEPLEILLDNLKIVY
jgi:hypothetical protein